MTPPPTLTDTLLKHALLTISSLLFIFFKSTQCLIKAIHVCTSVDLSIGTWPPNRHYIPKES